MADHSAIEWTDATWNPIRGCTRVSQGCVNCYAERIAAQFSNPGQPYEGLATMTPSGPRWTGAVRVVEERLCDPLHWRKPRRVFVNSMSDLFHESLSDADIARVWAVMAVAHQHTFQILTKRPERMAALLQREAWSWNVQAEIDAMPAAARRGRGRLTPCLDNVWLGVSVEDQATADARIPWLLQTPAAVRFLSCEPLLGPLDISPWLWAVGASTAGPWRMPSGRMVRSHSAIGGQAISSRPAGELHWVIVGGESGPHARPMQPAWALALRDQCVAAAVSFFFKQWGGITPKRAGRLLDGVEWSKFPEVANARV